MVTSLGGYTFEQFKEHMNFWLISGTSEWLIHGNFTKSVRQQKRSEQRVSASNHPIRAPEDTIEPKRRPLH